MLYNIIDNTVVITDTATGTTYHCYRLDTTDGKKTTDMIGIFEMTTDADGFVNIKRLVNWFYGATCYTLDEIANECFYYINIAEAADK